MLANMDMHLTPDVAAFQAVLDRLSPEDRARVDAALVPAAARATTRPTTPETGSTLIGGPDQ